MRLSVHPSIRLSVVPKVNSKMENHTTFKLAGEVAYTSVITGGAI